MHVKLSYFFAEEPILRQTPGRGGTWKGDSFFGNDPSIRECDVWVVLEDAAFPTETAIARSGRAILVSMEPPGVNSYEPGFLAQFDLVVSCDASLPHPNVRNEYQGLPWHFGLQRGVGDNRERVVRPTFDYDTLLSMQPPRKTASVSVISSDSSHLPGHRLRKAFVDRLRERLGDRIDVFGRGINPVSDKADAILPYRYHIALENSSLQHYWTEKLSDSFLGWALPIYWGCRNIASYFPEESLLGIDIERPDEAIATIEAALDEDLTQRQVAGLAEARRLVLDRYNTFDVIRRACESLPAGAPREITIRNQRAFRPRRRKPLLRRMAHLLVPARLRKRA